ncbi:DUF2306 domain-containing protein [soil metagenome]
MTAATATTRVPPTSSSSGPLVSPTKDPFGWWLPAALIALSAIPVVAGAVRVAGLAGGRTITPDNARYVAMPAPVVLHVIGVSVFCLLGAFQFSTGFRRRRPGWHRRAGRLVAACGLLSASSGLWMTGFYPIPQALQGPILHGVRMAVGTAMMTSIVLAVVFAARGQLARHRAWMIRAYALGQGAGTQLLILGPWVLVAREPSGVLRDLLMSLAWGINVFAAEWIIRRSARNEPRRPSPEKEAPCGT